ncbi:MAG TPA: hypothetical protein VIP55_03800 [Agromyces sp.]
MTVDASAVFTTATSGHVMPIDAELELFPPADDGSFDADTVAVFTSVPQAPGPVAAVTCTSVAACAASEPKSHDSVWSPTGPVIEHEDHDCESIAQSTPAGSESLSDASVAVPEPTFVTVMVNPTALPASTVASSAVFTTVTSEVGHATVTVALAGAGVDTVAVLTNP